MIIESVIVAYLGFHTIFEYQIFLALDNVFYYNKDTRRNQNKVINEGNIVCGSPVISKQYN